MNNPWKWRCSLCASTARIPECQPWLAYRKQHENVELTLVRQEQLLSLPVRVQFAIPETYAIKLKSNIKNRQKFHLKAWLGRDLKFGN